MHSECYILGDELSNTLLEISGMSFKPILLSSQVSDSLIVVKQFNMLALCAVTTLTAFWSHDVHRNMLSDIAFAGPSWHGRLQLSSWYVIGDVSGHVAYIVHLQGSSCRAAAYAGSGSSAVIILQTRSPVAGPNVRPEPSCPAAMYTLAHPGNLPT